MEEEKSQISQPSPQQPKPTVNDLVSFLKQKPVIILVIIVLLVLGIIIFVLLRKPAAPRVANDPTLEKIKEQVNDKNSSTAQIVRDYVYSQKTPEGYNYFLAHHNEICAGVNAKNCPYQEQNTFEINNSWSALAFYSAYKVASDQKDLDQSYKDLDKLVEYCQSQIANCLWVLAQPTLISLDAPTDKYRAFLSNAGEELLKTNNNSSLMIKSIEVRELALLYRLLGDKKYLVEAVKRLEKAKDIVDATPQNQNQVQNDFLQVCWYTLASAEVAPLVDQGSYYVEEASRIKNDRKIQDSTYDNPFSVNVQPCAETYNLLYKQTDDISYHHEGLRLMRHLETNFLDTPQNKLVWGEGGTVSVNPKSDFINQFKNQVNLTDTSYMLYLLYLYNPK